MIAQPKYQKTYLNNIILAISLFFIANCTGLETFAIGATGNIVSQVSGDYIFSEYEKTYIVAKDENVEANFIKGDGTVNVKIVKLSNGEELIGEFDDSKHIIKNPVVMIPLDEKRIGFNPWMPYAEDKEYQLKEDKILVVAEPSKHIGNEYNKAFGSGIVVP